MGDFLQCAGPGDVTPSRVSSAPPKLNSQTLFAYQVRFTQTPEQYDVRNDDMYEEFYSAFKEQMPIPPPLLCPQVNYSKFSMMADQQKQNEMMETGNFINGIIQNTIKEDDSPMHARFDPNKVFQPNSNFIEFVPAYNVSSDFSYYQQNNQDNYSMARDQAGCRILQQKLESQDPFEAQAIFNDLIDRFEELMEDPFGNYLCQKIMEVSNQQQMSIVINKTLHSLVQISKNMHGTRSVQKLIEIIQDNIELVQRVMTVFSMKALEVINDINGNHVIQKILAHWKAPFNQFIFDAINKNIFVVATHKNGCCVLQRCIDNASTTQLQTLIEKIIQFSVDLVQDAYGNYVVQYVLDQGFEQVNARLAQLFTNRMVDLARQKYSSNVIEKCLVLSIEEMQWLMIREIGSRDNIPHLISDQYGNYVLQKAINLSTPELRKEILDNIRPNLDRLKQSPVGKRVYVKLVKDYPELAPKSRWNTSA